MKIIISIECDEISDRDRELIHIYIRKRLEVQNKKLIIRGLWK